MQTIFFLSQFLSTLHRRLKYIHSNKGHRLPETILVHSSVIANGEFMEQPGILRADEDFIVKYEAFLINTSKMIVLREARGMIA